MSRGLWVPFSGLQWCTLYSILEFLFRDSAIALLSKEPLGSFIIRYSETQCGSLVLSIRVPKSFHPDGVTHYFITRMAEGYQIRGFYKVHSSLYSLVTHHSVMQELLPVPLNISRNTWGLETFNRDYEGIEDLRLGEEASSK